MRKAWGWVAAGQSGPSLCLQVDLASHATRSPVWTDSWGGDPELSPAGHPLSPCPPEPQPKPSLPRGRAGRLFPSS